MRWGLVPFWAKDISIGYKMINARADSLAQKPSFKNSFRKKRCLIPASGFYEWEKSANKKVKTPMYLRLKNHEPFAFAGLWDEWKDPEGEKVLTFTIITTDANDLIGTIHNRMPVILHEKDESKWLDTELTDFDRLTPILKPYPSDLMEMYEVSNIVNSPKNETPECVKAVKMAQGQ